MDRVRVTVTFTRYTFDDFIADMAHYVAYPLMVAYYVVKILTKKYYAQIDRVVNVLLVIACIPVGLLAMTGIFGIGAVLILAAFGAVH